MDYTNEVKARLLKEEEKRKLKWKNLNVEFLPIKLKLNQAGIDVNTSGSLDLKKLQKSEIEKVIPILVNYIDFNFGRDKGNLINIIMELRTPVAINSGASEKLLKLFSRINIINDNAGYLDSKEYWKYNLAVQISGTFNILVTKKDSVLINKLLKSTNIQIKHLLLKAYAKIEKENSIPTLISFLKEDYQPYFKAKILSILGDLRSIESESIIKSYLTSTLGDIKKEAKKALKKIETKKRRLNL